MYDCETSLRFTVIVIGDVVRKRVALLPSFAFAGVQQA